MRFPSCRGHARQVHHHVGHPLSGRDDRGLAALHQNDPGVALVSATVVRRELRPLERAGYTADAIAAGDFDQRLAEASSSPTTEVQRLAEELNGNGMLDQIQAALAARERSDRVRSEDRVRRFVADASHELRTPLQSLRGYAELYQSGALPDRAAVNEAVACISPRSIA